MATPESLCAVTEPTTRTGLALIAIHVIGLRTFRGISTIAGMPIGTLLAQLAVDVVRCATDD